MLYIVYVVFDGVIFDGDLIFLVAGLDRFGVLLSSFTMSQGREGLEADLHRGNMGGTVRTSMYLIQQ